jgi:energy-coupling factor transporter ATP-binding protein EcfA2
VAPGGAAGSVGLVLQDPGSAVVASSVWRDVAFGLENVGMPRDAMSAPIAAALDEVGLRHLAGSSPLTLSGGEQQRLALAIAVASAPAVLLADEPTSQLDQASAGYVAQLLQSARDRFGSTLVVVTHDEDFAAGFDRSVAMRDGRIGAEGRRGQTFAVVAGDGSVQLPAELLADFPPGTLVEVERTETGVHLKPQLHVEDPGEVMGG